MNWNRILTIFVCVCIVLVAVLAIFRIELYINYLAYKDSQYTSRQELSSDQTGEQLVFDSIQSPDSQPLQYNTLLGCHHDHLKSDHPVLYTTKNGLYTVDWVQPYEDNQPSMWDKKLVIRTDLQGKVLWTFQLEKNYSSFFLKGVFTSNSFVDEEENIYIQGQVTNRFFLWKKWVPRQQSHFLVSLNKEGNINWIYFTDTYIGFSEGVVKDQKVYLTTLENPIDSDHNNSTIICLDARNGKKLWDVQTSFLGESVFYSSFGIHIANSSIDEENQTVHANLKTISFDGEPLWEKTLDFPATLSETLPYEKQILFSSNSHHLYICFCANGRKVSRVSPEVTLAQTSQIVALDSSGTIEWEHQIPEEEDKWIHAIECNNNQLCIAGGTIGQTKGVPKDVFLTSFSPKGKIMWNTYIEGDETEPYLFFEPDVDPGSFVLGGLHLQMTKDAIVLATSTQSKDIQIQNGLYCWRI